MENKNIVDYCLKLKTKIDSLEAQLDKVRKEKRVMKNRLLKYEAIGMFQYNNKKGLNESTSI